MIFYKQTLEKKVGFVASKKVGNAVKRSFAKRRLRAVFLEFEDRLRDGTYIFIAKDGMILSEYGDCKKNIKWSLEKLGCFK